MSDRDQEYVEFVEAMGPRLRRAAYLVCGDWYQADDAVQDAMYKLYLAWSKVQASDHPVSYARRSVMNAALDGRRRPWRREVPTDEMADDLDRRSGGDPAGPHAARDELFGALARLAPRQRAAVVLRYYEDLSVEQAADVLGCSAGTVKSQVARGLETLRRELDQMRSADRVSGGD